VPFKDDNVRRERQREYSRRWYLSNPSKTKATSARRKREQRERWEAYRSDKACAHCGFSHPAVIDFHHVIRQNKQSVNDLAVRRGNVSAAIREAEEKCIPLCANCHRILHWQERRRIRSKRKKKARRKKA
jgi:hypothetical protein